MEIIISKCRLANQLAPCVCVTRPAGCQSVHDGNFWPGSSACERNECGKREDWKLRKESQVLACARWNMRQRLASAPLACLRALV